jgi:hypothetical protein
MLADASTISTRFSPPAAAPGRNARRPDEDQDQQQLEQQEQRSP